MLEVVYHLMGLQKILITTEYTTATMNQVRYVLPTLLRTSSLPNDEGNMLLSSWLICHIHVFAITQFVTSFIGGTEV